MPCTLKWQNLEKLEKKHDKSAICIVGQAIILQELSERIFFWLCVAKSSQGLLMEFRIISNWTV